MRLTDGKYGAIVNKADIDKPANDMEEI